VNVEVIYEDNHQLVLNKPAGLLTQPSGTEQDSLEAQAKLWLKSKYNKPGNVFLHAVHRLDKPVSGIVLFARTSKALSRLQEAMRQKQSIKQYVALVEGRFDKNAGSFEHFLIHDEHQARIASDKEEGKLARLHYQVLQELNDLTVLEITLETGRYHQIRIQFATEGHPIVGDSRYGSRIAYRLGAIALHHHRLQIPHPVTGEIQLFTTELETFSTV
jgi:23S rRNA pseudouridine1911/1915/1917 synthase